MQDMLCLKLSFYVLLFYANLWIVLQMQLFGEGLYATLYCFTRGPSVSLIRAVERGKRGRVKEDICGKGEVQLNI